ncbi:MAG TPA: hypothetical protein P5119_10540 [Candidatus Aminicenantes bacterium]|nr:hypothetical protein [Candidatus Aminicenantes bacterium]HRY65762.1 hypothetical protein [Candidatus Aminicenantes bacterium]HRZ72676.1 hypothetical protein [Candidatus Aminicenantes bacterium]
MAGDSILRARASGRLAGAFGTALALLLSVGAVDLLKSAGKAAPSVRKISVFVVADGPLRRNVAWKSEVLRALSDVNWCFLEAAGLRFRIEAYGGWEARPAARASGKSASKPEARVERTAVKTGGAFRSIYSFLPAFRRRLTAAGGDGANGAGSGANGARRTAGTGEPGGCEIAIGLVARGPDGPAEPGLADYPGGIVLVRYEENAKGLTYILFHELCHLFGAVDLQETGTVMSREKPGFRLDRFTVDIVRVNRDRSFRQTGSALSDERILQALALYRERQALKLGEEELAICIRELLTAAAARHLSTAPDAPR